MKRLQVAEAVLLRHRLIAKPFQELVDESLASSHEAQETGFKRSKWSATEGRFVLTVSGTEGYLRKVQEFMKLPTETFALFAFDDRITINKEFTRISALGNVK
jgi:hypothetical protein